MECGGGHGGGGFLPSFAFVDDDSLMDPIQLIRIIRMIRLWAAKEILEWWWASLCSSILLSSTTLDVGFDDHSEASPGMS